MHLQKEAQRVVRDLPARALTLPNQARRDPVLTKPYYGLIKPARRVSSPGPCPPPPQRAGAACAEGAAGPQPRRAGGARPLGHLSAASLFGPARHTTTRIDSHKSTSRLGAGAISFHKLNSGSFPFDKRKSPRRRCWGGGVGLQPAAGKAVTRPAPTIAVQNLESLKRRR